MWQKLLLFQCESDSQEPFIYCFTDFHALRRFYEPISISDESALCTPSLFPISSHRFYSILGFSPSLSLASTTRTNAIWASHQNGWIWDIDNVYGVRDGGIRETRVTRLLWRVPTTAIALSDWNSVPEGVWNITKSPSLVYISSRLIQTKRCNRE